MATPQASGSGGIPTGTQLQALLPYHSGQPAGWKLAPKAATKNSGSTLTPVMGLLPGSNSCQNIAEASGDSLLQWWQVSYAYADVYRDVPQAGGASDFYSVQMLLAGFQPGYAAKDLGWVIARAKACPTYHDATLGAIETTTYSVLPGLGDQAVFLSTLTKAASEHVTDQELLIRVGSNVAAVSQNSALGPLVSMTGLQSMAKLLIGVLQQHPAGR